MYSGDEDYDDDVTSGILVDEDLLDADEDDGAAYEDFHGIFDDDPNPYDGTYSEGNEDAGYEEALFGADC